MGIRPGALADRARHRLQGQVACGTFHTLVVDDGKVMAWGDNRHGQLGNRRIDAGGGTPVRVLTSGGWALDDVIQVAAGGGHSLALRADGTVHVWGWDHALAAPSPRANEPPPTGGFAIVRQDWQLPLAESGKGRSLAVANPYLVAAVAIAGGVYHSLALQADGSVKAWGWNTEGQLGTGSAAHRHFPPALVVSPHGAAGGRVLDEVVAIAAGPRYSLALTLKGDVYFWGSMAWGERLRAAGTPNEQRETVWLQASTPTRLAVGPDLVAIAAGHEHALALGLDGTIWGWGSDLLGQLGGHAKPPHRGARRMAGRAIAIDAGAYHTLALDPRGVMRGWGSDHFSQGPSSRLTDARSFAAGAFHNAAISTRGKVLRWGRDYGSAPQTVVALQAEGGIAVGAGADHNVALNGAGQVQAWGANTYAQAGQAPSVAVRGTPGPVGGAEHAVALAVGASHATTVQGDGTIRAFGHGWGGALGGGVKPASARPVTIETKGGGALDEVVAVASGNGGSIALRADGTLWAWGWNAQGQSGTGSTATRIATPQRVAGIDRVIGVAQMSTGVVAVRRDGGVWAWGHNRGGSLGVDRPERYVHSPYQVRYGSGGSALDGVIAVAAGDDYAMALTVDGRVLSWGANALGATGHPWNGQLAQVVPFPRQLPLNAIVGIAAGCDAWHGFALDGYGDVWGWGSNRDRQLPGARRSHNAPFKIAGRVSEPEVAMAAGGRHSLLLRSNGYACTVGADGSSQGSAGTTRRCLLVH